MRAIILAAGKGVRLNGTAGELPKCLVKVGGLTLIERQIQSLRSAGIDQIVVVIGHGADIVRQACGPDCTYVENSEYATTNSLFSLWLARDFLRDGFVVLNADVLFHPQLLADLLLSDSEDALLISYADEQATALGEEEMKVCVRQGCVTDISKAIDPREADGENVGIVKFGPSGALALVKQMDSLIANGARRDWAPRAFRELARERPLQAISTRGRPWIEIDFPEDYLRAINEILPLIGNDERGGESHRLAIATSGDERGRVQHEL
ncbi:MAG TPA: phosphocholine cytidylyltransferase family protein [Blastocatellia bacterium]|nr:phosphocholine cytidylyltransferase family protein [Blastocatellia bacterium]